MEFTDKRVEKLVKKVKPFLDDRQKPKTRLTWLYSFIETAPVADQSWFFKNFHNHVFQTLRDGFSRAVGKIRDAGDKKLTMVSKEIVGVLRISALLRKMFLIIPNLVHTPEVYGDLEAVFRSLMQHGNHQQLRLDGFRTFLCFLTTLGHSADRFSLSNTVKTPSGTELVSYLLGNAVLLDCFEPFELPKIPPGLKPPVRDIGTYQHVKQRPIEALDCFILLPGTSQLSTTEMTELINEYLQFLELCAEATVQQVSPINMLNERYYHQPQSTAPTSAFSFSKVPAAFSGASKSGNSSNESLSSSSASNLPSPINILHIQTEAANTPTTPIDPTVSQISKPNAQSQVALSAAAMLPIMAADALNPSLQNDGVRLCGFLWDLLVQHYLRHILALDKAEQPEFPTCPRQLLHCFLSFLKRLSIKSQSDSPDKKLLLQFMLSSTTAVSFIHHTLQQSLLVPLDDGLGQSVALLALGIIGDCSEDIAQKRDTQMPDALAQYFYISGRWSFDQQIGATKWLQYHIRLLRYLFLPRKNSVYPNPACTMAVSEIERQVERMLGGNWFELCVTISETMLDIYEDLKPGIGDWFGYAAEIMFTVVVLTNQTRIWQRLQNVLERSLTDLKAWKHVLQTVTFQYAKLCFDVDLAGYLAPLVSNVAVSPTLLSRRPSSHHGRLKEGGAQSVRAPEAKMSVSQKWLIHPSCAWTADSSATAWKNVLIVAGNPAGAADAQTHLFIVTTLVETLENLFIIRQLQRFEALVVPDWFEFIDWLFGVLKDAGARERKQSVLTTLGALCRAFSTKQETRLDARSVSKFYKVLQTFSAMSVEHLSQILCNSVTLAVSRLPAVHLPVKQILESALKVVQELSIRDLYHLLLFAGSFVTHPELCGTCPDLFADIFAAVLERCAQKAASDSGQYVCVACLAASLLSISLLHAQLTEHDTSPSFYKLQPDRVARAMQLLYASLKHPHIAIVHSSSEALSLLELNKQLCFENTILEEFRVAISERLQHGGGTPGSYAAVSVILQFTLDIILIEDGYGVGVKDDSQLLAFFDALEALIAETDSLNPGQAPDLPSASVVSSPNSPPYLYRKLSLVATASNLPTPAVVVTQSAAISLKRSISLSTLSHQRDSKDAVPPSDSASQKDALGGASAALKQSIAAPSEALVAKQIATGILSHVVRFRRLFPLIPDDEFGGASLWSSISELDASPDECSDLLYVAAQKGAIIAAIELEKEDRKRYTRWIVRDCGGRFVFDSCIANRVCDSDCFPSALKMDEFPLSLPSKHPSQAAIKEFASFKDPLLDLLEKIEDEHPDCVPRERKNLREPGPSTMSLAAQNMPEKKVYGSASKPEIGKSATGVSESRFQAASIDGPSEAFGKQFMNSRLLLSVLCSFKVPDALVGRSLFESKQDTEMSLLRKSPSLLRDLKGLDKRSTRETIKAAVLYVKLGQETEQAIVHNTEGSEAYQLFTQSLGRKVDVATHLGYLGGIERDGSNGSTVLYYCNSLVEMVFHDVTQMPNDPDDPKQVRKKRHIGNDHVHIVWSEHSRDYKRDFIRGDFGNVAIVVHPLPDGRYSVKVWTNSHMVPFPVGPCVHQMIVPGAYLSHLVRTTVIHAYRTCLASATMNAFSASGTPPIAAATGDPVPSLMHSHGTLGATFGALDAPQLFSSSSSYTSHVIPFYLQRRPPLYALRMQDLQTIIHRHALSKSDCSLEAISRQLLKPFVQ